MLSFLYILLQGCNKGPCGAPDKVNGIPQSAIWHGGCDGGYWFEMVERESLNKFHFKIYNDVTGNLLWDKYYQPIAVCEEQVLKADYIHNIIAYQNDNKIYLTISNGSQRCYLEEVGN